MLDYNNPQSENIYTASSYIDRMKTACYDCVLVDFAERQSIFKFIMTTAKELAEFSETAFPESIKNIAELCDEVIREAVKLSVSDQITEPGKCKICNGELVSFQTFHKGEMRNVPLCAQCSKPLIRMISALERPTGVWAI